MARIISIISKKGGVGKTTMSCTLSAELARRGFKTLVIDADTTQANATQSFLGPEFLERKEKRGFCQVITQGDDIEDVILKVRDNLDIAPSEKKNKRGQPYNIEQNLNLMGGAEAHEVFYDILTQSTVDNKYDFVIIDTPPSLGAVTLNAIRACDYCLIPVQINHLSYYSSEDTIETIIKAQALNPDMRILGMAVTSIDKRPKGNFSVIEKMQKIAEKHNIYFFETMIPVKATFNFTEPNETIIDILEPTERGRREYQMLVDDILERIKVIEISQTPQTKVTSQQVQTQP